jgi:hypothetical protein
VTAAEAAVFGCGLPVSVVCDRARVGRRYLVRLCREGAPYDTAQRVAAVVGCSIEVFLPSPAVTPACVRRRRGTAAGGGRGARRKSSA